MTTSRRDFVRNLSLASASLLSAPAGALTKAGHPSSGPLTQPADHIRTARAAKDRIRLAVIGTGFRGESHIALALRRTDTDIVAVCDVDAEMLRRTSEIFRKAGKPMPRVFTGSPYAYRDLLATKDIDAVLIATPWEWHAPMVLDSIAA
ncbi:MAG TPA: Gfo/Idh/MocA family oxidoreductase, partial [Puia sp.]|nr:Gfo/Idh/MocA family oxidoreductase [Puia sp.]